MITCILDGVKRKGKGRGPTNMYTNGQDMLNAIIISQGPPKFINQQTYDGRENVMGALTINSAAPDFSVRGQ